MWVSILKNRIGQFLCQLKKWIGQLKKRIGQLKIRISHNLKIGTSIKHGASE